MATKKGKSERLEKANMQLVIGLLNEDKPITKKEACTILNINYNTTRLGKLIEEFEANEAAIKVQRRKKRGKPLSTAELSHIAQSYLNQGTISGIAETLFRPFSLIKEAVEELNIPMRDGSNNYFNPPLIPDKAIKEDYVKDDLVYSARYQCPALINKEDKPHSEGKVYNIYLLGLEQCYASQPYWELSDLTGLQRKLGISILATEGVVANNKKPFIKQDKV